MSGRFKQRLSLCLLAMAVFAAPGGAQAPLAAQGNSGYLERLRTAAEEAGRGEIAAAMADVKAAVAQQPDRAEGWYQLGSLLGQTGDFPGAETALRRAIALKPEMAKAHFSLALTLIANPQNKLDWSGAMAECREALKYQPEYAEALNLLGAGLTSEGKTDEAIAALEQSVRLAPKLSEAHFNLGLALESKSRFEDAVREYRAAIDAKGGYPEASSALAKLQLRMGKAIDAEKELNAALCLNPDLQDAHYTLGRTLHALGREREAGVEYAEARELGERRSNATQSSQWSNKGLELAASGDLAGAEAALRKAIALKPDYGVPHYNLGLILADRSDLPGARAELAKAISLMPGQARPWFDLGRVLRHEKDDAGAVAALSWAAHLAPSDAKVAAELASTQVGLPLAGTTALRQPRVGVVSDNAADHLAFARELFGSGDFQGAVGELLRTLAESAAAIGARRSLADAYVHLGEHDRAALEYWKIVRCAVDDTEAHLALGKLLLMQGDAQAAKEQIELALKYQPDSSEARQELEAAKRAIHKP